MTEPVILVSDLVKRYGEVEAVRGIGFEVQPGETFGFLGPNGAGKSTTIEMMLGLLRPDQGTARVFGLERSQAPIGRPVRVPFRGPIKEPRIQARLDQTAAQPREAFP